MTLNPKCVSGRFKLSAVLPLLPQTRCPCWRIREQIFTLTRIRSGAPLITNYYSFYSCISTTETVNSDLRVLQNAEEAVWFDVGVFKTLFSEVSHYYLPADSDQTSAVTSGRPSNSKEVKYPHICSGIMASPLVLTCAPAVFSCRGGRLDHMTSGAETSGSCSQVRPTGSGLQASTALAKETSARSASSRPASRASLERLRLSKSQRCRFDQHPLFDLLDLMTLM